VEIPPEVPRINPFTFEQCTHLRRVRLPLNLAAISPYAFMRCSSLSDVTMPAGVEAVGGCAFYAVRGIARLRLEGPALSSAVSHHLPTHLTSDCDVTCSDPALAGQPFGRRFTINLADPTAPAE
jgi:hypothetical protein